LTRVFEVHREDQVLTRLFGQVPEMRWGGQGRPMILPGLGQPVQNFMVMPV
jgi:hypothetical protein